MYRMGYEELVICISPFVITFMCSFCIGKLHVFYVQIHQCLWYSCLRMYTGINYFLIPAYTHNMWHTNIRANNTAVPAGKVQPSAKREGFATTPDVSWDDIGALEDTREELSLAICEPIRRPDKVHVHACVYVRGKRFTSDDIFGFSYMGWIVCGKPACIQGHIHT